jgi:hypothetical protein
MESDRHLRSVNSSAMNDDLVRRLEAVTAEAVAVLGTFAPGRDWLDEILDRDGDALRSDEAAFVWNVSVDTARRRAEIAAETRKPIAVLMAGALWLFSERRLLDAIEAKDGRSARLAAESRAQKSRDLRLPKQNSAQMPVATAR